MINDGTSPRVISLHGINNLTIPVERMYLQGFTFREGVTVEITVRKSFDLKVGFECVLALLRLEGDRVIDTFYKEFGGVLTPKHMPHSLVKPSVVMPVEELLEGDLVACVEKILARTIALSIRKIFFVSSEENTQLDCIIQLGQSYFDFTTDLNEAVLRFIQLEADGS